MAKRRVRWVVAAMALMVGWTAAFAGGVVIVSQRGGEGYTEAKNGFLQTAYGAQLPGLNPKAVELDGTDADEAALKALKEQAPDLVFALGPTAVKQVRKALPEVFIVYGMVFFPESDGFLQDTKMVGVASLGPVKELGSILKALVGKPKNLVILHSVSVSPSIADLITRLKSEAGIEARGTSVENPGALKGAVDGLKGQTAAVVFLPDALSLDAEAFKGAMAECVAVGIIPVALADVLVANGALCGSYFPPEEVGAQAARTTKEILEGKVPANKIVSPAKPSTSCNRATATGLRVKFPKEFRPETTYE